MRRAVGRQAGRHCPDPHQLWQTCLRAHVPPDAVWKRQLQRPAAHPAKLELLLRLGRRLSPCRLALTRCCRRQPVLPPLLLLLQVLLLLVLHCTPSCACRPEAAGCRRLQQHAGRRRPAGGRNKRAAVGTNDSSDGAAALGIAINAPSHAPDHARRPWEGPVRVGAKQSCVSGHRLCRCCAAWNGVDANWPSNVRSALQEVPSSALDMAAKCATGRPHLGGAAIVEGSITLSVAFAGQVAACRSQLARSQRSSARCSLGD